MNVRAGGGNSQTDKNFNVDTYDGPASVGICCVLVSHAVNLGADQTPVDPGLRPQTVEEYTDGSNSRLKNNLFLECAASIATT